MAVSYDDSTMWDYTLQDFTTVLLTILPYSILLLIIVNLFLRYKEKIFKTLEKISCDYKNNENIFSFLPKLKSKEQSQQELIEKCLETLKNEDMKLMEIQEMVGKTNDKLQSFCQRMDNFQDLKDTCSRKYGEIVSTFNEFSNDVMGKLDLVGRTNQQQEHEGVEDEITEDSAQDPITMDAKQDVNRVDSEITGPDENKLKRNSNHRSKIPVFGKINVTNQNSPFE
ncbi:hypothetical protein LSTR_LSTR006770 [Laodelphax striatellus]|uniref:Uncharacterized protein n=1 Tax=Laodelphax striatellus TaxID=195883 RepID=A0A482XK00_LAOST|nr:hypothetical protein LSTR_LSTR006770 [Laodelphax striatellus]